MQISNIRINLVRGIFVSVPLLFLLSFVSLYQIYPVVWRYPWVHALNIELAFRLDALSFLFAGLISFIGFLIQIYTLGYMDKPKPAFRLHLLLTFFMFSMLGLVLADNLILLFVFWELTSLSSYLLISFDSKKPKARENALQALLVTTAGGLAVLVGFILMGEQFGTYSLSEILLLKESVSGLYLQSAIIVLILAGAMTKSALFPFHFWLPNAMVAPTPVSAYLHSATMVKAGIYLLFRVSPLFSDHVVWTYGLGYVGAFTAIWCASLALRQNDLKLMLAYSTNTALGILAFLIALGTQYAIFAALLFVMAHAIYKASLFMVAGMIDKAVGTRDIRKLAGLRAVLPMSCFSAGLGALSMAGIPPLLGFISKEYHYKAGFGTGWQAAIILLFANTVMAAIAFHFFIKSFTGSQPSPQPVERVEKKVSLWLPALFLSSFGLIIPLIGLRWIDEFIIHPATRVILENVPLIEILLWQGFNAEFLFSMLTILLGVLSAYFLPELQKYMLDKLEFLPKASDVYTQLKDKTLQLGAWLTGQVQSGFLSQYILVFFSLLSVCLVLGTFASFHVSLKVISGELVFYEVTFAILMLVSAGVAAFTRSRLLGLAALGVVGFMITLIFMLYSAPDLAKTQLLVESLIIIFMALIMGETPPIYSVENFGKFRRIVNFALSCTIGICIGVGLYTVSQQPFDDTISNFYALNSVSGGHGRNIVNVILVDFRAFDTLGEIIVVFIASLAAMRLYLKFKKRSYA